MPAVASQLKVVAPSLYMHAGLYGPCFPQSSLSVTPRFGLCCLTHLARVLPFPVIPWVHMSADFSIARAYIPKTLAFAQFMQDLSSKGKLYKWFIDNVSDQTL